MSEVEDPRDSARARLAEMPCGASCERRSLSLRDLPNHPLAVTAWHGMEGEGLPWWQRHRVRAWVGPPNHGPEPSTRNSSTSLYPRLGHAVLPEEEDEEGGQEGWLASAGSSRRRRLAHDMLDAGSA